MPVAAEDGLGTRSKWGQLWGQLQKIEQHFTIEFNRLAPQFNGARLHHLFHLCPRTMKNVVKLQHWQAFDTTPEFWLSLQANHDLVLNRPAKKVRRLKRAS